MTMAQIEKMKSREVIMRNREQNLAIIALLFGASATSLSPIFIRLSDLEPLASAFHRMAWALPILWIWLLSQRPVKKACPTTKRIRDVWLLIACGVFFSIDLIALHLSIELTAVANAILFLNMQPIYIIIGSWVFLRTRPSLILVLSIAITLCGAFIMVEQSITFGHTMLVGDILGLIAGICYAGFILAASHLRGRYNSVKINVWTVSIACPLLFITTVFFGQPVVPQSLKDWSLMLALGIITQAIGQGLIIWGLIHLSTNFSSITLMVAPVASTLFAWVFLDELISAQQLLGMVIVLGGIYFSNRTLSNAGD